jgi:hypothetical protein
MEQVEGLEKVAMSQWTTVASASGSTGSTPGAGGTEVTGLRRTFGACSTIGAREFLATDNFAK